MAIRFLRVTTLIVLFTIAMQAWAAPPPACPTISVGPLTTLPDAAVNTPYTTSFDVTGSATPYAWSITGGLPSGSGLSIAATGTTTTADLTGTPVKSGGFLITVTAGDSNGCNGGRVYSLNIPPDVVSTTPANTATNVALNVPITINFSESVTAGAGAFSLECPSGTPVTIAPSASPAATYTLNPSAALPSGTTCSAKVTAAQIASVSTGDAMPADYSFTFTTATQPAVVPPTTPPDTATGVAVNTAISIPFNENVNAPAAAFTLACAPGAAPTILATNTPSSTITLGLSGPLPAGSSCTVTALAAQITDAATSSAHPAADYPFSFTTVTAPAVVPPTTPAGGSIDVAVNTAISIPFNQSVNAPTAAFTLACGAGTPTIIATNTPSTTITLTLSGPLPAGAPCTLTALAAQITDAATSSSHMAANFPISFTTVTAPAVVPPPTPTNGATNVAVNTAITIPFNESVNAAAAAFTLVCTPGAAPAISSTNSPAPSISLTLSGPLPAGSSCTVTALAAQITDAATSSAHLATDFTFTFTTVTAPAVVPPTTPANGAVNVLANATISLPFNESVNAPAAAFTLVCAPGLAPSIVATNSPGTTITLALGGQLPFGSSCTVTALKAQITDALTSSAHPAADFSFSFTTVTQPAVISTIPASGATNVLATTAISLTFNESVNAPLTAFTLACGAGTPTITGTNSPGTTIALTLSSPLPGGASCTVTALASQITDAATSSAHLAADFPFSFTVDTPPSVASTIPTNGATGVPVTSTVSITFSKSVNVTGTAFALECPTGSPVTFTVTPASPATTFVLHPTANLPAGVVCTATVVATQVTDLVGTAMTANYVFTFNVPPVAQADTYPETVIGNVSVNSSVISFSVTSNDSCTTGCSITAFDATSANGGTVSMTTSGAGIGQFTYDPPAGYTGPNDTFTYTLGSAGGSATATVTVPISGVIWFINSAAGTNGNGRLSSPFNTLAAFQLVNDGAACLAANNPRCHPAANGNVFLYESGTDYIGPVTLLNGQKLIGQDATASLATITGLTPGTSSAPLPAMNSGNPAITNVTNTTGGSDAVRITNASSNTIRGLTIGNVTNTGTGINMAAGATTFGTLTIGAPNPNQDVRFSTNGRTMNLQGGTLIANLIAMNSSGGPNNVNLTTIGGTSDFGSPTSALSGATGTGFLMSGGTATITYSGTIAAGTQAPIVLQNRTAGTVSFSGAVTSATQGISLLTNTGATTAFTGGIGLSTGTNAAFTATGGGTVTATQDNVTIVNTLATTTGTALNVANTTIGAAGLTFRSIASNGAASGIILNTTGASGGLTVTGDGTSDPANTTRGRTTAKLGGGTVTLGSGGTIAANTAAGISLNSTSNVVLRNMSLTGNSGGVNSGADGIHATTVGGLTLDNVLVTGIPGNDGLSGSGVSNLNLLHTDIHSNAKTAGVDALDIWNVRLDNLTGTCAVTNSLFFDSLEDIFTVTNTGSAVLNMTITNSEFRDTSFAGAGNTAFAMIASGVTNAVTTLTATGSTFKNAKTTGFQYAGNSTSSGTISVTNNVFGGTPGGGDAANQNGVDVDIAHQGAGTTLNFDVSNNTMRQGFRANDSTSINIFLGGLSTATTQLVGSVKNNIVGIAATANSGSDLGAGIAIDATGAGTVSATVTGNNVNQVRANSGNVFDAGMSQTAKLNLRIRNNIFNGNPAQVNPQYGIHVNVGTGTPGETGVLCMDMSANSTTMPVSAIAGVDLDSFPGTNANLIGYAGAANNAGQIQAFLQSTNTTVVPAALYTPAGGSTQAAVPPCSTFSFPP